MTRVYGIMCWKKGKYADLLELVLLCCLVFARSGGLSIQLFCCELELEKDIISGLVFS